MREVRIEQQELGDPQRPQFGGIFFAIGFKCGAVFQESNPLQVFVGINGQLPGLRESAEMRADQGGKAVGALHVTSKLNIVPAFAVAHCRVGYSLKKVRAVKSAAEKQL